MLKATFREREQLIAHYEGELIPGPQGPAGPQGVGISTIEKTGTSGLVDTYTITLTNGDTTTFEVTNGEDGEVTTAAMNAAIEAALSAYSEGDYPDMQVGGLISDEYITDNAPYIFRPTAGGKKVGNREWNKLVGGTVAWNQLVPNENKSFSNSSTDTRTQISFLFRKNSSPWTILVQKDITAVESYDFVTTATFSGTAQIIHSGLQTNFTFANNISVENGHKYLLHIKFTGVTPGTVGGVVSDDLMLIDLTSYLNPTIADYVYSLEQATAGSGIAWLKKYDLIDDQYHAYNAGSLGSVNVSAHIMRGRNLLPKMVDGTYEGNGVKAVVSNGVATFSGTTTSSGNAIIIPLTEEVTVPTEQCYLHFLNSDVMGSVAPSFELSTDVGNTNVSFAFSPANRIVAVNQNKLGVKWDRVRFYLTSGVTLSGTFSPMLCYSNEAMDYAEPWSETHAVDSSVTLRGMLKTDADGNLYYDGDTYEWDGTVTRKYAEVDLGSLSWNSYTTSGRNYYVANLPSKAYLNTQSFTAHSRVIFADWTETLYATAAKQYTMVTYAVTYPTGVYFYNDGTYATADAFKTAMNGVYLQYELATPTTESADPYTNPQVCDPDGTEEWTDYGVAQGTRDYAVPVGHETNYIPDLSANTINDRITALEDGTYTPDNPTAAANVTSGKYFMVGSVLYKATASIAAGDKIVVGTNCTKPSIADALNSLS